MRYKDCFDKERRDFLRIVQRAGISAGLLRASSLIGGVMLARTAEAQSGVPTKSCLVFSGGGCQPNLWYPSGGTFPAQSAPLQTHYSRIAVMKNASLTGAGHGIMFHRFDNASFSRDSFDVNMGRTIGANYPVKYLNVGTTEESQLSREGNASKPTITSPQNALDILFSGGTTTTSGTAPRKSIVDLHYPAVNSLKTKLGQHEKEKLDSHFTAIQEIEAAIGSGTGGGGGGSCPRPTNTAATGFDALAKLQTDIIVLALNCNLTASVSIAFGSDAHNHIFDKLGGRSSHQSHHFNQAQYTEDIAYMQGLTKNLLDKLNAQGLLSSTTVFQMSDMGLADAHGNDDVPMILAGAGITGGRTLELGKKTQADIFHTLALKMRADQSPNSAAYRNWGGSIISGL
uniref:Lysyl-tRNA synthetase n=1 Tax=uncultured organism TaxID=155900 RepID=D8VN76_9ZZZZ|nr:lysyl-tRNA synthetase [uncultured organism]